MRNIVAVSDPGNLEPGKIPALVFHHRHYIRKDLAWMVLIGQPVYHRYVRPFCQLFHDMLAVGADHQAVQVAGKDPGSILQGLTPFQLKVPGRHEGYAAAKLEHGGLEGDPGPGGRLFKEHAYGLARSRAVRDAALLSFLQLHGTAYDLKQQVLVKISDLEIMSGLFFHLSYPVNLVIGNLRPGPFKDSRTCTCKGHPAAGLFPPFP